MTIKLHCTRRVVVFESATSALCQALFGIQIGAWYFGIQKCWIESEWHTGVVYKTPVTGGAA